MGTAIPKLQRSIEDLTLSVAQEIHVKASIEKTFESLLAELGPEGTRPDGTSMYMKIEPWAGGRWWRDIGNGDGHLWAHIQAVKRPTLLELYGPLFMSYPATNNVQYRLSEVDGGTLIKFHHLALGLIDEEHRTRVVGGWSHIHEAAKQRAEKK